MIGKKCGLQDVHEKSQPLPARVSGDQFDFAHWRTDVPPVGKHFHSTAHSELDMMVMVISSSIDPRLYKA